MDSPLLFILIILSIFILITNLMKISCTTVDKDYMKFLEDLLKKAQSTVNTLNAKNILQQKEINELRKENQQLKEKR